MSKGAPFFTAVYPYCLYRLRPRANIFPKRGRGRNILQFDFGCFWRDTRALKHSECKSCFLRGGKLASNSFKSRDWVELLAKTVSQRTSKLQALWSHSTCAYFLMCTHLDRDRNLSKGWSKEFWYVSLRWFGPNCPRPTIYQYWLALNYVPHQSQEIEMNFPEMECD